MLEDLSALPPRRLEKELETIARQALACRSVSVFDGNPDDGLTVALDVDSRGRPDILDLARVVEDDPSVQASCGWSLLPPIDRRASWQLLLRVSFERPVSCAFAVGIDIRVDRRDAVHPTVPLLLAASRLVFAFDGRLDPDRPVVWIEAPVAREPVLELLAVAMSFGGRQRVSPASR
jgi:hypothetical protein